MSELPEVVTFTLERLRRARLSMPEMLLETWGWPGGGLRSGVYAFADLIGFEDELVATVRVEVPLQQYVLVPIRERLSMAPPAEPFDFKPPRVAVYKPLNYFGRTSIAAEYLPGWKHDMTTFTVGIALVRYRRAE